MASSLTPLHIEYPRTPMKMPVGAQPQVLMTASGRHRAGLLRELTSYLLKEGVSIATSKKVMLHNHFALLASLWLPPHARAPEDLVIAIESGSLRTTALRGCNLSAELIVLRSSPNDAPVNRRLRLACPQKPGLIKSITDLLKDQACTLVEVDTNTSERNGEVRPREFSTILLLCVRHLPALHTRATGRV